MPDATLAGHPCTWRRCGDNSSSLECYSSTRQRLMSLAKTANLRCTSQETECWKREGVSESYDYCWSKAQIPICATRLASPLPRVCQMVRGRERFYNCYLNMVPSL